ILELHALCLRLLAMSKVVTPWRFISFNEAEVEPVPPGKTHFWYCKPDMVANTNLLFVRCRLEPGAAHNFHYHPKMEELLYVLSGEAEQWVERDKKILRCGDCFYVPAGVVHSTFNIGAEPLEFLAILSPAKSGMPFTVEVGNE